LDASDRDQVFIGIAGGPGSGKSSVARAVCDALNKEEEISIVVPMDGYHYSKAELKRLGNLGKVIGDPEDTKGESTTYEDLMARRGAPWTFCPKTLIRDLTEAKSRGKGTFPIYSREISDPVPDGVELTLQHKIVLCEGNYLLAFDDEDWKPLEQIWDDKWYVSVPQDIVVDRLVDRHLKRWNESKIKLWGEGRSGATAKAKASDLKNFRWVEKNCKPHAVLIVENY
jgi:pantothenate kinase